MRHQVRATVRVEPQSDLAKTSACDRQVRSIAESTGTLRFATVAQDFCSRRLRSPSFPALPVPSPPAMSESKIHRDCVARFCGRGSKLEIFGKDARLRVAGTAQDWRAWLRDAGIEFPRTLPNDTDTFYAGHLGSWGTRYSWGNNRTLRRL